MVEEIRIRAIKHPQRLLLPLPKDQRLSQVSKVFVQCVQPRGHGSVYVIDMLTINHDPLGRAVAVGQFGEVRAKVLGGREAQALIGSDEDQLLVLQILHFVAYSGSRCLLEDKDQVQSYTHNNSQVQAEEETSE